MHNQLQALAQLAAEFDVIFDYYLARIDGELVLAINTLYRTDQTGEFEYRTRQIRTRIYRANGSAEEWIEQEIPKGQNRGVKFTPLYELQVPVEREVYEEFYDLWAETGADETMRARRRAYVKMNWLATDLLDLSGGY